ESDIEDYRIFPSRPIAKAARPLPLPEAPVAGPVTVTYRQGGGERSEPLDELLRRTETRAFLVIRADRIVFEHYGPGMGRESVVTSFSAAKSFDSALIGAAIADGFIGAVDDPVIRYLPELA